MKVRGKLTVTDGVVLSPAKTVDEDSVDAYVLGKSTPDGVELVLGDLVVYNIVSRTYKKAGSLVRYGDDLYISIIKNARGEDIADPLSWRKVNVGGISLTTDQLAAIQNSDSPSATNPFATLGDVTNLTIEGTAPVETILGKPATVKNIIWISSTIGQDSFGVDVVKGDGLISTGAGWKNIGPIGATAQQSTYVHTQGTASAVWTITHNLDRFPSVVVVDEFKEVVSAVKKYMDKNIVEVTFSEPVMGAAYLN